LGRTGKTKSGSGGTKVGRTFSSNLNYLAFKLGGRDVFFGYARLSDNEAVKQVVALYDEHCKKSNRAREHCDIEELCRQVDYSPARLLGEVTAVAYEFNKDQANLIAAINHPRVVQATVDNALTPKGVMDRKFLHLHQDFIPTPRPVVINNRNQTLNVTPAVSSSELPPFHERAGLVGKIFRKQLPAPQEGE